MRRIIRRAVHYLVFLTITVGAFLVGAVVLPSFVSSGWTFLVGWIASGAWLYWFAKRRISVDVAAHRETMHAIRAQAMLLASECAVPWRDGEHACLCVRPYGHTGPHLCGICEDVTR
ncbi:hypothetical protein [uncultured Microbacterium sp.]|uniref:hypothetical protein n=1 Tax=uncultured Microbacterium sp. TaxID=191216 RepID=UPI0025D2A312|nr:hypothetical protein [uncultured Microbacterium sp.]